MDNYEPMPRWYKRILLILAAALVATFAVIALAVFGPHGYCQNGDCDKNAKGKRSQL